MSILDISSIDISLIRLLASDYNCAMEHFGTEPIYASGKLQRKIRKWLDKNYLCHYVFPEAVLKFTNKNASDADVITFTKECFDYIEAFDEQKKQLFDAASADLSDEVKEVIWEMLSGATCLREFFKIGEDIKLCLSFGSGYDYSIIFVNASGFPDGLFENFYFANGSLTKQDDVYCLTGETEDYSDNTEKFTLKFTDAKIHFVAYKLEEQSFNNSPWFHLEYIASSILDKNDLSPSFVNEQEKALIPLIKEVCNLSYFRYTSIGNGNKFVNLRKYIDKYHFNELLPLIEKAENLTFESKNRGRVLDKINTLLNKQKYEPLWRAIFDPIVESQKEYPTRTEIYCSEEELQQTRNDIQRLMESLGYSGSYPDFQKCTSLRGLRLEDSYNKSYFISNEKTVICRIHCTEEYFMGRFSVEFLCATEFVRDNEPAKDVYSCLFDCGGKRLFSTVRYNSENVYDEEESPDLAQIVEIAAKTAELKKLTRQERSHVMNPDFPSWKLFCLIFIVLGGLFGVFMTVGFMLIELLVALIFGEIHEFPSLFMSTPWWMILAFCWASFSGIMGIITVIAKLK